MVEQETHGARGEQAIFENGQYVGTTDGGACGESPKASPSAFKCLHSGNACSGNSSVAFV